MLGSKNCVFGGPVNEGHVEHIAIGDRGEVGVCTTRAAIMDSTGVSEEYAFTGEQGREIRRLLLGT